VKGKLNVLAVDDNSTNNALIAAVLRKLGHDYSIACNGIEALEEVRKNFFDIIVMDIEMPVLDGIEAAKAIRRGECGDEKSGIPIIALTAHALKEVRDSSFEAGINGYITKPVNILRLDEILRCFADGS
jgi:CheY-like chemotaxis protein